MAHIQPDTHLPKRKEILIYTGVLNQTGTAAPTVQILHNTLGTVTWIRDSSGVYTATLPVTMVNLSGALFITRSQQAKFLLFGLVNSTQVRIRQENSGFTLIDNITNATIEIRIYDYL